MKKLLILGAGIYQVPLIKKAKDMGLYTIVASYPGNYPGLAIADEIWEVDTRDADELLKRSKNANISGVCTSGTDVAIRSLGILCETLHLSGLSKTAAEIVTDKAFMKEAFIKHGVSCPRSCKASSYDEAFTAFEELGAPVIVKAVDSSGSRGITKADSPAELLDAWHAAKAVTKADYILVEKFIAAHEIGVDGFILNGEISFLLPHDKFTHTVNGTTLPAGHAFPFHCTSALEQEIHKQVENAVYAVGLNNCAINADVLITESNAYILEIGGRAGATCIPELISLYGNFDYYEQMIRNALGMPCDFTFHAALPCMAKLLFSTQAGTITAIDDADLEALRNDSTCISLDYKVGDTVEAVRNGTSRIGHVIMKTDNENALTQSMSQVRSAITIDGENLEKLWHR